MNNHSYLCGVVTDPMVPAHKSDNDAISDAISGTVYVIFLPIQTPQWGCFRMRIRGVGNDLVVMADPLGKLKNENPGCT